MTGLDLDAILRRKRIVVCCGSGGIGKTTVSAALGLRGALQGKSVLTLTIDPAKRLANSLGLQRIGNTEALVPREKFLQAGLDPPGRLFAMMLDTKHTFDELIGRYAPNEEMKRRILDNRFYQNLSTAMAGSHEYLAMEKLYQIYLQGSYDLIVLDTPPTRHALDFLEAPSRVRAFFDRSISQWFLKPYLTMGRIGLSLVNRSASTVIKLVERVTGAEFLRDVSEFVTGLADAFDIFKSRAEEVMRVLQGEAATFLLVTGPERAALEEATYFYRRLRDAGLPFGGIIVNRVHTVQQASATEPSAPGFPPSQITEKPRVLRNRLQEERGLPPEVARRLVDNYLEYQHLSDKDTTALKAFVETFPGDIPLRTVPVFDEDIFDIEGLARVNTFLFSGP